MSLQLNIEFVWLVVSWLQLRQDHIQLDVVLLMLALVRKVHDY